MTFALGAVSAAFLVAVIGLVVQHVYWKRAVGLALAQESRALDRAAATELRSAQQIDAMLERISTQPRLEIAPGSAQKPPLQERRYIADHPADDVTWNEYRGEPSDDEVESE